MNSIHHCTHQHPKTSCISAQLAYALVPNLFITQPPNHFMRKHSIYWQTSLQPAHMSTQLIHAPVLNQLTQEQLLLMHPQHMRECCAGLKSVMPYSQPLALLGAGASPLKIGSFQEHQNYIQGSCASPEVHKEPSSFPRALKGWGVQSSRGQHICPALEKGRSVFPCPCAQNLCLCFLQRLYQGHTISHCEVKEC